MLKCHVKIIKGFGHFGNRTVYLSLHSGVQVQIGVVFVIAKTNSLDRNKVN